MSSQEKTKEEPKQRTYRLSVTPESAADLKALKQDLIQNEQLRFRLYLTVYLQNVLDYEKGKRQNISTIVVREE